MSLFKKFGNGNRSKSDPKAETARALTTSSTNSSQKAAAPPVAAEAGAEAMDPDEAEARAAAAQLDLPFRSGKKGRNLSISRSGRHRYKKNQRASVVTGEVFSTTAGETSPAAPSAASGGTGSGSASNGNHCRDVHQVAPRSGGIQTTMARTPTAV